MHRPTGLKKKGGGGGGGGGGEGKAGSDLGTVVLTYMCLHNCGM